MSAANRKGRCDRAVIRAFSGNYNRRRAAVCIAAVRNRVIHIFFQWCLHPRTRIDLYLRCQRFARIFLIRYLHSIISQADKRSTAYIIAIEFHGEACHLRTTRTIGAEIIIRVSIAEAQHFSLIADLNLRSQPFRYVIISGGIPALYLYIKLILCIKRQNIKCPGNAAAIISDSDDPYPRFESISVFTVGIDIRIVGILHLIVCSLFQRFPLQRNRQFRSLWSAGVRLIRDFRNSCIFQRLYAAVCHGRRRNGSGQNIFWCRRNFCGSYTRRRYLSRAVHTYCRWIAALPDKGRCDKRRIIRISSPPAVLSPYFQRIILTYFNFHSI